jgi:hypothetical protein
MTKQPKKSTRFERAVLWLLLGFVGFGLALQTGIPQKVWCKLFLSPEECARQEKINANIKAREATRQERERQKKKQNGNGDHEAALSVCASDSLRQG